MKNDNEAQDFLKLVVDHIVSTKQVDKVLYANKEERAELLKNAVIDAVAKHKAFCELIKSNPEFKKHIMNVVFNLCKGGE